MSRYRQQQCETMLAELKRAGRRGVTRAEFAKLLDIKKGTHLNGLIAEIVTRDLAFLKRAKDDHNRDIFVYFPIEMLNDQEALPL